MKHPDILSRRLFIRNGLVASTLLASIGKSELLFGVPSQTNDPDQGLKLGLTTYTLRKFNLDQALAMTREANLKYISLKDIHLPLKSSKVERMETRKKVQDSGLVLMGGGVIYMKNDEQEIRNAFEYAKDAGMPTIICSPEPPAMDTVETLAKQFQIRIAIHNHGPGDKHYPSPLDVLRLVNGRDPLIGICMDVGHTVRNGENPVSVIEQCGSRLYDFHMKDVTKATEDGKAIEVGKGVTDIPGVLKALIKAKFHYHVALEYEAHAEDPLPGIKESIGYIRGALKQI